MGTANTIGEPVTRDIDILALQLEGLPPRSIASPRHPTILAYATLFDRLVIVVGCICAVTAGALNPLLTVIYGNLVGSFQNHANGTQDDAKLKHNVARFTLYFVYLAAAEFVLVYISTVGLYHTGQRISQSLRKAYLKAILRQNAAFFDRLGTGEVTTRLTSDTHLVQEAISGKIALCLTAVATFCTAFIVVFIMYWKLALVLIPAIICMASANAVGAKYSYNFNVKSLSAYSSAASIAEEAIRYIKHVTTFNAQESMAQSYFKHIRCAEPFGIKARLVSAVSLGSFIGVMYLSYGLSFWQGSRFLVNGDVTGAGVVTATMAIVIGALAIGRIAPNTEALVMGLASASEIFKTISRRSCEDPFSIDGIRPNVITGNISFRDVRLVYPSRPDVAVLDGINLDFPSNKKTALVGISGSGKSSIVKLIERFYMPLSGTITLDDNPIESLNLRWLRHQVSLVSQEPVLFDNTIFENIRHGLQGHEISLSDDNLRLSVIEAAKSANAHDFIVSLPEGYETRVGESGLQLSGGQRQRIAIARALIRNPRILLLDEATSALDSVSEVEVQRGLDSAAEGRTTIIIAHRLSTIQNADNIIVLGKGRVIEQGSHEQLIQRRGVYYDMNEGQILFQEKRQKVLKITPTLSLQHKFSNEMATLEVDFDSDKFKALTTVSVSRAVDSDGIYDQKASLLTLMKVVMRLNRPDRWCAIIGLLLAIIAGCGTPTESVFFAKAIQVMSLTPPYFGVLRQRIDFWCLMYLMLGIVMFGTWVGQGICFAFCSERLTRRARDQAFRTILRQDIAFFSEQQHSIGTLTSFLSTSSTKLAGLSGAILGAILIGLATLLGGIILSIAIGWKLALVCLPTMPIVLGCGWARLRTLALFEQEMRKSYNDSASFATEAVSAIDTVASTCLEDYVLHRYGGILDSQAAESLRSILIASALYAASYSATFLVSALGFWYGGTLLSDNTYTVFQFFVCFSALVSGSQTAGAVFSFAPDIGRAVDAARQLNCLFDKQPIIDSTSDAGVGITECDGNIELRNVSFAYPSRPDREVLCNLSLSIRAGQFIALVGSSGCGKSTIIGLLERFYNPTSGTILLDGRNVSQLKIQDYRGHISLVGQEPTIYQGTIRDNIVFGIQGIVSDEDIKSACKEASIYDFITSLPDGFATVVGTRGNMLSGGQKQRIAIASAILRNPRILLLDEATSALDADAERVVQQALDAVAKKRTTIAVAHRLSTIQNADQIFFIDRGQIVESGTHRELIEARGAYFDMVELQNLERFS